MTYYQVRLYFCNSDLPQCLVITMWVLKKIVNLQRFKKKPDAVLHLVLFVLVVKVCPCFSHLISSSHFVVTWRFIKHLRLVNRQRRNPPYIMKNLKVLLRLFFEHHFWSQLIRYIEFLSKIINLWRKFWKFY